MTPLERLSPFSGLLTTVNFRCGPDQCELQKYVFICPVHFGKVGVPLLNCHPPLFIIFLQFVVLSNLDVSIEDTERWVGSENGEQAPILFWFY